MTAAVAGPESGQPFTREVVNAHRFWSRVAKAEATECWVWRGASSGGGYGTFDVPKLREGPVHAHRVSWVLKHGSIPKGMCVLHRCDNPPCVNPDHLRLGTQADNIADMIQKGRAAYSPGRRKVCRVRGHVARPGRCLECRKIDQQEIAAKARADAAEQFTAYFGNHFARLVPDSFEAVLQVTDMRRALIFARFFGLFDHVPATCQDMASEQGLSRERVRQLRNDVLFALGAERAAVSAMPLSHAWKHDALIAARAEVSGAA